MKIKTKPLICFDLDETLIHSNKAHIDAFNKIFTKHNLKRIPEKKFASLLTGVTCEETIKVLFPKLTKNKIKKIVVEHNKLVKKETGKYARAIKGAVPVLRKLKKKFKLGLISNCSREEIFALLKGAGINRKLFDVIIGKYMVRHAKPYPDEIFKAEKLVHSRARYMVGDSIYDIRAGKRAGVKTILVLTGNDTRERLKREKPFKIIKSIADLPKVI